MSEIPRIAIVSGSLNLGGTTTFVCNLAGELVRRGIPAFVLSFEKGNPLASDFERQNIPVLRLDHHRHIFEDRLTQGLQALARFDPSVVIANLGPMSFEVLRYLPAGVFRVGTAQSDDVLVRENSRRYASVTDAFGAVSISLKRALAAAPEFASVPVHYLPYGVPLPATYGPRDAAAPIRILYLGRLYREQKRVHLFPLILQQLKATGMTFHWTIAGDGIERGSLERAMTSSPGQTVLFQGPVSYAQVPELLRTHNVFLLASDFEGLPLSLLEAMGAGLVPVVSQLPSGIPEVVNDTNGILVPVRDTPGYARAIHHLAVNRDELAAKSAAARATVESQFSIPAMTDRWLAILPKKLCRQNQWPSQPSIQPPLGASQPFYFSPPMRTIRRMLMKMRRMQSP